MKTVMMEEGAMEREGGGEAGEGEGMEMILMMMVKGRTGPTISSALREGREMMRRMVDLMQTCKDYAHSIAS